jgi:hypothetical protein
MKLITRAQWGARQRRYLNTGNLAEESTCHWNGPTITIGGKNTWDHAVCFSLVRGIQNFHMDGQGWSDIAYNFLECPHGYTFEGRGINVINGANGTTYGNQTSHAICCLAGEDNPFLMEEKVGFKSTVQYISDNSNAPNTCKGHRDHKETACPGDARYRWVHDGMPITGSPPVHIPDEEDDDMPKWSAVRVKENPDQKWLTDFIVAYPLGGSADATVEEQQDHINILRMQGTLAPGRGLDEDGHTVVVERKFLKPVKKIT